jgi:hypothetical protein
MIERQIASRDLDDAESGVEEDTRDKSKSFESLVD